MQKIRNVALLDLRKATKEKLQEYEFGKVGLVVYNEKTSHLSGQIKAEKVAGSMELPDYGEFLPGEVKINKDFLTSKKHPRHFFCAGYAVVTEDVDEEDIEKGLEKIVCANYAENLILCPEHLARPLFEKAVMGQIKTYPKGAKIFNRKIKISPNFLDQLEDNSKILIQGPLDLTDANLNSEKLKQKISHLDVTGRILSLEAYRDFIYSALPEPSDRIEFIPEGFRFIPGDFQITSDNVDELEKEKLYIDGLLIIKKGVTEIEIKKALGEIKVEGHIVCPRGLKSALRDIRGGKNSPYLSYQEDLVIMDGNSTLTPDELNFLPDKFTLLIKGNLEFSPGIEAKKLNRKLEHVDLFGIVEGSSEILGAIKTKTRTRKGVISFPKTPEDRYDIENIAFLEI